MEFMEELEVSGFMESPSRNGLSNSFFHEHMTSSPDLSCQVSTSYNHAPVCRQFWKAGDYPADDASRPVLKTGQNRLRVHPKFLHSNATSHKWAFGAIAELLDNTVDEVCSGATVAIIDKISFFGNNHALLIQDNGGGMDPDSIRHCLSFGFSDKQSNVAIGHYGNGFKSSTMRLGADVIVFSRCLKDRKLTQSVGILSYTFLRQAGCSDIIVPMVDYNLDLFTRGFTRQYRYSEKHFCENLSIILRWSPYAKEEELLNQFNYIGDSGTRIVVYNLWQNDNGYPELDFDTNEKDILISGALNVMHNCRFSKDLNEQHIGNCFRYSLRAYASILYLRLPENFRIFLRDYLVVPHYVAEDLIYTQVINYKPQIARTLESEVIGTVIGFLNGAPNLEIQGFNIYHRNRLILPFWRVVKKCKGVVGVLQVECLKPTHDKQDFQKSDIFIKLEIRLKEMAMEYWKYHHHLVGYTATKISTQLPPGYQMYHPEITGITQEAFPKRKRNFHANLSSSSQAEPPEEENPGNNIHEIEARKKQLVIEAIAPTKPKIQIQHVGIRDRLKAIATMVKRRQHLKEQFIELKKSVEELTLKDIHHIKDTQDEQRRSFNKDTPKILKQQTATQDDASTPISDLQNAHRDDGLPSQSNVIHTPFIHIIPNHLSTGIPQVNEDIETGKHTQKQQSSKELIQKSKSRSTSRGDTEIPDAIPKLQPRRSIRMANNISRHLRLLPRIPRRRRSTLSRSIRRGVLGFTQEPSLLYPDLGQGIQRAAGTYGAANSGRAGV